MDTEEGHLKLKAGLVLGGKYMIRRMLGQGTFGRVFECATVKQNGPYVAAKVIRAEQKYRRDALEEVAILDELADLDPDNEHQCVRMLDCLEAHGHFVLVFEALGPSLADELQRRAVPFSIRRIRSFGRDVLRAIQFLHKHKMVHTDLKTPNVLLETDTRDCRHVKVIDFGGTRRTTRGKKHTSIVQTRQYRAPEVMLESGWNSSCDLWSIGCILMELYTGNILFPVHGDKDHLAMLQRVCGLIPEHLIPQDCSYFTSTGNLADPGCAYTDPGVPLQEMFRTKDAEFCDVIKQLLALDPKKRISASNALEHPFFCETRSIEATEQTPVKFHTNLQLRTLHTECDKVVASMTSKTPRTTKEAPPAPPTGTRSPKVLALQKREAAAKSQLKKHADVQRMEHQGTAEQRSDDGIPNLCTINLANRILSGLSSGNPLGGEVRQFAQQLDKFRSMLTRE
jgi:serine/threonine protein kinase